jgi:hypothetical protein
MSNQLSPDPRENVAKLSVNRRRGTWRHPRFQCSLYDGVKLSPGKKQLRSVLALFFADVAASNHDASKTRNERTQIFHPTFQ